VGGGGGGSGIKTQVRLYLGRICRERKGNKKGASKRQTGSYSNKSES
jgi:hypothetical protein